MSDEPVADLIRAGRVLFELGLVDSHSGNLSRRHGGHVWITRSGAMLGWLTERDLVRMALPVPSPGPATTTELQPAGPATSCEWIVHAAVYRSAPRVGAVLHAHAPMATAAAFHADALVPVDSEARGLLGDAVPVVAPDPPSASPELADAVAGALAAGPAVIVRRHGIFVAGEGSATDALRYASAVEHAARIRFYAAGFAEGCKS